VAENLMWKKFC